MEFCAAIAIVCLSAGRGQGEFPRSSTSILSQRESSVAANSFQLPTRRLTSQDTPFESYGEFASPSGAAEQSMSREKIAELMRPSFRFSAEWQAKAADIEITSYGIRVQVPTFPIFGPPPPFFNAGFSYTDINAPLGVDLPGELFEYSFGSAWMRPVNDMWMFRLMASAALATDGKNSSSDAWQFRGGVFAMYRPNPQWTWIFGALALGRNDLPAVPAIGAIWKPHSGLRFDLTFPRPRISVLLLDTGPRQQWGYLGAGLGGGTWAYERMDGHDDQLTFRDWRVVLGWESTPTPEPGMPITRGRKLGIEVGYVFGREFEFDSDSTTIDLNDSFMLRGSISF